MPTVELRPYQKDAVDAVAKAWREGASSALLVMPCGVGKTVVAAEATRRTVERGKRVLFVVGSKELVTQTARRFESFVGAPVAVEMAERRELSNAGDEEPAIVCASIQSITRRLDMIDPDTFDLLICDEAHHGPSATFRRVRDHFARARLLGLTATPYRHDGKDLGDLFDVTAFTYRLDHAIKDGWLAPLRAVTVHARDIDFSKVRYRAGDFCPGDVQAAMESAGALAAIAKPLIRIQEGRRAIVFVAGVRIAHELAAMLCDLSGDPDHARGIDGKTPDSEKAELLRRFAAGEIRTLCNASLLVEGIDVPEAEICAIARPTASLGRYVQMVGRVTRKAEAKPYGLVVDFVPSNCRHDIIDGVSAITEGATFRDDHLAEARRRIARESREGHEVDLLDAMTDAHHELQRQAARKVNVRWSGEKRDPLRSGPPATDPQVDLLHQLGMKKSEAQAMTLRQAQAEIDRRLVAAKEKRENGLATLKQARVLTRLGYDPDRTSFEDAAKIIDAFKTHDWKKTRGLRRWLDNHFTHVPKKRRARRGSEKVAS